MLSAEQVVKLVGQAERRRVPGRNLGAAFDEAMGRVPLTEGRRVVERRAAAVIAPGTSMLAPASNSASSASRSSLLAAQCNGVSACLPSLGTSTSAPASMIDRIVAPTCGKCPGQSVATWMGLAVLIEAEDELELVGQAADGREALAVIRRTRPMSPCSTSGCRNWTASRCSNR